MVSMALNVVRPVQVSPCATVKVGAVGLAALTPKELPSVAIVGVVWMTSGE